ncbi:MAG TPA: ABC transporter permease subunit [Nocardioidaceae bacterium]|nr:ABC transporter permease subunit [Nocardioidaceae bacterium]
MSSSVLYDAPGPRAKRRHAVYSVVGGAAILALLGYLFWRLWDAEQITPEKWEFLQDPDIVNDLLEGLRVTLSLAAAAIVLAVAFGAVFAAGRLSDHWFIRLPCIAVVEVFRAIPVLLMILFLNFTYSAQLGDYWSIVLALMVYNGSVLAEVFRAGILAVPKGQSEAGLAIGLRKAQVTRLILAPQAISTMLPAIISQCVVALKDTALGYAIGSSDITDRAKLIFTSPFYNNPIAVALMLMAVFVTINYTLSLIARLLEARTRRRGERVVQVDSGRAAVG